MSDNRLCSDCSSPITRQSTTGRCRPCAFAILRADPEWEKRRKARLAEKMLDPEYRRRIGAIVADAHRRRLADEPKYREQCRQRGLALKATGLGNAAQPKGSAIRMAVGRKLSDQRLTWCPREYRQLYQEWRRVKGKGAREARRQVEKRMAEDKAMLLALSPFQRQLEKIRRGAGIIEVMPIRAAEPAYSLTGNGSAACAEAWP